MSTTASSPNVVRLVDLGPVRVSEPWFSRRLRIHQAWYRVSVLGIDSHGTTRPPHERPLGSILPAEDARQRMNFLSSASSRLFDQRRSEGWGIDPVRTLGYLTSSQAMTLNLIGPLAACPQWLMAVLNSVLPGPVALTTIESVAVEHFARRPSEALGDRTTIDVMIRARTGAIPIVIALETKLGDRFNSRRVSVGSAYSRVDYLWKSPDVPRQQTTSQLARVHALAEHVARTEYTDAAPTPLLLLFHDDDPRVEAIVGSYGPVLAEASSFRSLTLSEFLVAMRTSAPSTSDAALVDALSTRYVDLTSSESVWREFLETFPARRRKPR